MKFYALIPAAGSGSRMGGSIEKQYMPLNSVPMIAHAMMVLAREPRIAKIFVVLSPTDKRWNNYEWQGWEERIEVLRCGGATRAETVLNGLDAMSKICAADDWVLVHDAARPCLPDEMLGNCWMKWPMTRSAACLPCRWPTPSSAPRPSRHPAFGPRPPCRVPACGRRKPRRCSATAC
jgi:2-C-methyl-D-erythritol 4-phosphate cytidylyltransferase